MNSTTDIQQDEHVMSWGDWKIEQDRPNWPDEGPEYQIEDGELFAF